MSAILTVMVLILGAAASPGPQASMQEARPVNAGMSDLSTHDYRLGPGDLLELSVFGVPDLDQEVRISSSGSVFLPLLGRITVEDMTGEQLEKHLTQLITERQLIRDPQVSIFIKEYRSQPIYVLGAVNQPGQYMITQQLRLIDAVTMAGGIDTKRSDDYLLLQRKDGNGDDPAGNAVEGNHAGVTRIDLKRLLEQGDITLNLRLEGGDVIQVPERKVEVFFVVGEVNRPGVFEFPRDKEKTVLATQALAWAGGTQKTAKMNSGVLVRYENSDVPTQQKVNFSDILKGKKADLVIKPNDIIFVPGSTIKTLGYGVLAVIPGTLSGALIWHAPF